MRYLQMGAAMLVALSSTAYAGGFERSDQSVGILFKEGTQFEFAFRGGFPELSGTGAGLTAGQGTGNIAENFVDFYGALKFDIDDSFSAAVIYDEPFATDIAYPGSGYFASNSNANLKVRELAGVLQYNLPENMEVLGGGFSVYGGPRASLLTASANIPFSGGYNISADRNIALGYLAGIAWERPELAMRASLTYNSEIRNDLNSQESFGVGPVVNTTTEFDTPESLTLELQTGLNEKTILFGSIRGVAWGNFEVRPPHFSNTTGNPLVFFPTGTITYRAGLGRKITEDLSIFGDVSYEPQSGEPFNNLTPRDGFYSFGAGATYTIDRVSLTVGARYVGLGDADTIVPTPIGDIVPAGEFRDNSAFLFGARIGIDLNDLQP